MGGSSSKDLLVGSLNFSGICLSPFEYHDCSVEKDFMSSKFQEIMKKYIKDEKFCWDVGKIDQKLQKQRYTPIYLKTAGVQNNMLLNRSEFENLWDQYYKKSAHLIEKHPTQAQVKQAKLFDWIAYETFLNIVYNDNPKATFDLQNVKKINPGPYKQFLKQWHSKSYLSNQKKMDKVCNLLKTHNLDVLCLQEAEVREQKLWNNIIGEQYQLVQTESSTSIIIFRKDKFPSSPNDLQFQKEYRDKLNFNSDSVISKRGDYLIISGHLSSKSDKYGPQADQMIKILEHLKNKYHNLKIIMGIDCNHFMNPKKYTSFHICPSIQTQCTTIKKRTAIQLQTKKTNVIVMETKDQIVANLPILENHVVMINGKSISDKTYLPCSEHPFDHFLVWCRIQVLDQKEIAEQKRKQQQK